MWKLRVNDMDRGDLAHGCSGCRTKGYEDMKGGFLANKVGDFFAQALTGRE